MKKRLGAVSAAMIDALITVEMPSQGDLSSMIGKDVRLEGRKVGKVTGVKKGQLIVSVTDPKARRRLSDPWGD